MNTNEVAIKIINKLNLLYGNLINMELTRQMINEILYKYDINTKETLPALNDNMSDKIMLYLTVKKTEGLADSTIKSYGRTLGRFMNYLMRNVEDVSTMDIRIYLADRMKEGLKPTTIANTTDILRGFFNWLEGEDYIPKSPMTNIKTIKVDKKLRDALTKEQFELLRTGTSSLRQKALLELLYSTGCRLEEIEKMKITDIDWQRLIVKVIGKGNKERVVYINSTAKVHLQRYLNSRIDNCNSLFITQRKPIKFLGRRAIQREIDNIMEQSGLNINVYPHLIRHTFATHMINSGMNLNVLQEIMGHISPDTTLVYTSLDFQMVESEYRKYS